MQLPQPGTLFQSRYRLDEVLGAGGFATVFRATDTATDRVVALKVLRPEPAGYPAQLKGRFEREVEILASLRDEHTVTMFDHGTSAGGLLYLVTEFIDGEDLEELIERRGRLDSPEVIHIMTQVLTALQEAHSAGLLHRDIKPANIRIYSYMGDSLRAMLLDFGIAKSLDDHSELTADGELVGTLRYMSPEQLMSQELTPASDLYSLGVVAFQLLLGSEAIQGARLTDQMDRLRSGHVFSVPELERIGPGLASILNRMTARRTEDRFRSATQVLQALAQLRRPPSPAPQSVGPAAMSTSSVSTGAANGVGPPMLMAAVVVGLLALVLVAGFVVAGGVEEDASATSARAPNPGALIARPQANDPPPRVAPTPEPFAPDGSADTGLEMASPGCGRDPGFRGEGVFRAVDGLDATEVYGYVPDSYDLETPSAAIVMLHENGDSPRQFIDFSGMTKLAEEHRFVIVAPNGGFPYAWTKPEPTIAAIQTAIETVEATACVDPRRVFAVGHAAGGGAAELAAANLLVRAIATTSHRDFQSEQMPPGETSVPYLHLAPTKDEYNRVEGGTSCGGLPYISLAEQEKRWRDRHDCESKRSRWLTHGPHRCFTWECDVPFVTCHLSGGRNWPGLKERVWDGLSGQNCDGQPADFPFGETIWRFFEQSRAADGGEMK